MKPHEIKIRKTPLPPANLRKPLIILYLFIYFILRPRIRPRFRSKISLLLQSNKYCFDLKELVFSNSGVGVSFRILSATFLMLLCSTNFCQADIKIGVAGPMSGPNAAFGRQMRMGTEQAIEDINSNGGIFGQKLIISIGDDQSDPRQGVSIANRFVNEGVKFVIGHFNSGISIPASEIYNNNNVIMITPSSTNPKLTERNLWNVFRTSGRDDGQGIIAADYIKKKYPNSRVGIISDSTIYGQGLAESFKKSMNAYGTREQFFLNVQAGQTNFSSAVEKIRYSADIIFWGGLHTEGGLLIRQMREQGVNALMISGDGITSDDFSRIAGNGVIGTLMTFPPDPRNRPEARSAVNRLNAKNFNPEAYTLYSYAALEIIKQSIEQAGSFESKNVAKIMHSGKIFRTVIGNISYDSKGDRKQPDYTIYVWKNVGGKITYVEDINYSFNTPVPSPAPNLPPAQSNPAPSITTPPKTSSKSSSGTAFRIANGQFVTNHHVIEECTTMRVGGKQGGTVLSTDPTNDLALISVPNDNGEIANIRTTRTQLNEAVTAAGYPLQGAFTGIAITNGTISRLSGLQGDTGQVQISAPVQPGNSGGPLLDSAGNVIGVVSGKLNEVKWAGATGNIPQNVNFAIGVNTLRAFLDAKGVNYKEVGRESDLRGEQIAQRASGFTVLVECR